MIFDYVVHCIYIILIMGFYFGTTQDKIEQTQITSGELVYPHTRTNKPRENRWWIWLTVAVGGIIITLSCLLCYEKVKKHKEEGN